MRYAVTYYQNIVEVPWPMRPENSKNDILIKSEQLQILLKCF